MKKIIIEMSPTVHGSRAVKRCLTCLVRELMGYKNLNYELLYFDYKHQKNKYIKPINNHTKQSIIKIPQRLMIPLWKKFSWPNIETLLSKHDLFYVNEFYFPPAKKAVVLATIHGLFYELIPDKIPNKDLQFYRQGLSYILKHADYLVAVSESTKNDIIKYAGVNPERIFVVTHGVDNRFRNHQKSKDVWKRLKRMHKFNHPYILYVGAIGVHKNIMGILFAYDKLSQNMPHHLVLAGPPDSAWNAAKQFVSEKKLTDRVHFLGHVHLTEDLVDLYNAADLFVFPSFYEGWTSPPLESMACGTPVITSNCSSLPETVGEAAILVDPNDIDSLANKMENVLSDKILQRDLITKGFAHVSKHTWEKSAEKLVQVFEKVLAMGPWEKSLI
jgi:glycosyltransferase involved in cell wall biosynthesis